MTHPEAGDQIVVARAWQEALYGPAGFYRAAGGPAAHFATSAQGIPGVGALLAELVVALAHRESLRHIVDFACGRGELLNHLHQLDPQLRLTGVDIVARPADLPAAIQWVRSPGGGELPRHLHGLTDVLVLAHEWLDVVPCDLMAGGRLRTTAGTAGPAATAAQMAWAAQHWPHGTVVELGDTRDAAYGALRDRIATGLLVCVDYGHVAHSRPTAPTLMGFRGGVACAPEFDGSTDITAHVAMDSLGADELIRQADLAGRLIQRPQRPDYLLAQQDPAAYVAALRRQGAWSAFVDPAGLGAFWWSFERISGASDEARR